MIKKKFCLSDEREHKMKNKYELLKVVNFFVSQKKLWKPEKYLFKKYFKLYDNILDLGCGTGRTTKYLHDKGFKVIGVDNAKNMIKKAKEIYPKVNFRIGDATNLNYFNDETYDIVFFSACGLDYIYPKEKRLIAIKEIERTLKPNGLFIFSMHDSRILKWRPFNILENYFNPTHSKNYRWDINKTVGRFLVHYSTLSEQIHEISENTKMILIETIKFKHPFFVLFYGNN